MDLMERLRLVNARSNDLSDASYSANLIASFCNAPASLAQRKANGQ
jgi:hypothetical protein